MIALLNMTAEISGSAIEQVIDNLVVLRAQPMERRSKKKQEQLAQLTPTASEGTFTSAIENVVQPQADG